MLYSFMTHALLPACRRGRVLYRGITFPPVAIAHLRLVEVLFPGGAREPWELGVLAYLLSLSPAAARRAFLRGGALPRRLVRRTAPRTEAERTALLAHLRSAWSAPPRFLDPATPTPAPADRELASSPALRLLLRAAAIPGVHHLLPPGTTLQDLPIQDAIALIVADEEVHGAHYLSADTAERLTPNRSTP